MEAITEKLAPIRAKLDNVPILQQAEVSGMYT